MKRIFAALLALILCVSANAASFTDTQTHWAKDSIDYVADKGLFKGTSDNTFSPELTMSRAMLCTVLYRYAGSPAVAKSCTFGDVPADVWYTDAMAWAQSKATVFSSPAERAGSTSSERCLSSSRALRSRMSFVSAKSA